MRDEPVRVMIFCDHIGYAGSVIHGPARWLSYVLPLFDRTKVRIGVAVLGRDHPFRTELQNVGIDPIILDRSKNDIRSLFDMISIIKDHRIEIVYLLGFKSFMLGRIAARVLGRKAIINLRDMSPLSPSMRVIMRMLAGWTDLSIGVSDDVAEFAIAELGVPRPRSVALPNAIPVQKYAQGSETMRTRARRRLALDDTDYVVAVIGRLVPVKCHQHLLRAFAKVIRRVERAKLVVIGDGPLRHSHEELARQLGIAPDVIFAGHRDDVPDLLPGLDLVAFASMGEGRSIACLEAIAACRPVVGFDVTGINNVVVNGQTGILVEKGDLDALANAIVRLHSDPALYQAMARRCGEIRHAFDIAQHPRKLEQAFLAIREGWDLHKVRRIFLEQAPISRASPEPKRYLEREIGAGQG